MKRFINSSIQSRKDRIFKRMISSVKIQRAWRRRLLRAWMGQIVIATAAIEVRTNSTSAVCVGVCMKNWAPVNRCCSWRSKQIAAGKRHHTKETTPHRGANRGVKVDMMIPNAIVCVRGGWFGKYGRGSMVKARRKYSFSSPQRTADSDTNSKKQQKTAITSRRRCLHKQNR